MVELPVTQPMAILPPPLLIKDMVYLGQQSTQFKDYILRLPRVDVSHSFRFACNSIFSSLIS